MTAILLVHVVEENLCEDVCANVWTEAETVC